MSAVLFCTGGSRETGIGHVMRCQALAQAAAEQGLDSLFVVNEAARQFIIERHDWSGRLILAADTEQALASQLTALAAEHAAVAIVLDGYGFSESLLKEVSHADAPLVLLDDIRQPGFQYADILCNPAGEVWREEYTQANPTAMLCLGARYRLLRREFSVTQPLPINQRFSLTINMGGSDPAGLTLPVLEALTAALPDAPFRVVTGPGMAADALDALTRFIGESNSAIQHVHNCQDMADLWINARLAVVAAGGSQFELAACLTPSVLLTVAANQRQASEEAARQGWCEVMDAEDNLDLAALTARVKALWQDENRLEDMSRSASEVAVTDGAWQLLAAIADWRNDQAG